MIACVRVRDGRGVIKWPFFPSNEHQIGKLLLVYLNNFIFIFNYFFKLNIIFIILYV